MSYKLKKPCTNIQYADFVVEHNHKKCRLIEETEDAFYALEEDEMIQNELPVKNPNYETEKAQKERENLNQYCLTGADVERAIYKVKNLDFNDLIALVEDSQPEGINVKALKIELKANHFYRGNPYVEQIGQILNFSTEQLDRFFKTNDYTELTK